MPEREFEARILRFEQDWRLLGPRVIDDYLGEPFGPGSVDRARLLVELICVDLECRWRNLGPAGPATLEIYLGLSPGWTSIDRLPLEIVGEAYRARRLWGDRPSHAEFLALFGEGRGPILAELIRVDAEIDEDSDRPAPPTLSERVPADLGLDGPLLSDRDFLLRRLIGAGRMGKVYEARQHGEGPDLAVKFLRKTFLRHPGVVRRFVGEARTVAGMRHPHIVGTRGLGRTDAGSYFLVMDLVKGRNLAQVAGERVITEGEAIRWTMELCEALEHAHERGVVHCDLKPANILLDDRGKVRVTDFGLARSIVGETPGAAEVEGTAPFMAPEQACPSWGPIDQRTDVYGIGAVLHALLTGRPPFTGGRLPDILAAVIAPRPVPALSSLRPGLSRSLDDLCRKCLSKPPGSRFPTARDVRSALAAIRMAQAGAN